MDADTTHADAATDTSDTGLADQSPTVESLIQEVSIDGMCGVY